MNPHFLNRRVLLGAAASTLTLCVSSLAQAQAQAQAYPTKPIRMVVPFAAGGATDVLARILGEKMTAGLGQPIIIDNKSGAAGIIGTNLVAKASADGHTLVLSLNNSVLTNQFLYDKLPYSTQRDLTLVCQIAMAPVVLMVHPSVPSRTARMGTLPNVPTLAEQGLKDEAYRVTGWLAIAAPAGTPRPVVQRIADEVRKAMQQPDVQARVAAMGFEIKDSSPEVFPPPTNWNSRSGNA